MSKDKRGRFIGKIKKVSGRNGDFLVAMIDNPHPKKEDGSKDPYHKGQLIWFDAEDNKMYLVKQLTLTDAPEKAKEHGFTRSLLLDLDSKFHVEEIKQS